MADYLHECLERHGEVTRALYSKRQDLEEIERRSKGVVGTGRLTYDDVEAMIDAKFWRGAKFWQWPTREEFERRCEDRPLDSLPLLSKGEGRRRIVDELLAIFLHIEPVSVVLRFVDPENFGILSPPVEKLLEIGPAHKPRDKYLRYIEDLRELRAERGFETAAEVDMALWVVSHAVEANKSTSAKGRLGGAMPEYKTWDKEFWADKRLRVIRVRNLTESLRNRMEMPQFAEALLSAYPRTEASTLVTLAAQIAGIEFDKAVMRIAREHSIDWDGDRPSLSGAVSKLGLRRWEQAVRTRNKAVHGGDLGRGEVNDLVRAMNEAIERAGRLAGR